MIRRRQFLPAGRLLFRPLVIYIYTLYALYSPDLRRTRQFCKSRFAIANLLRAHVMQTTEPRQSVRERELYLIEWHASRKIITDGGKSCLIVYYVIYTTQMDGGSDALFELKI